MMVSVLHAPVHHKSGSRAVFAHSDTVCTVGDVICAAFFLGEAQPLWEELRLSVEAQTRAEEQELEADADALQSLSEEFRYQRDLITTEETEQWLEARDLTLEDFENHLFRLYWRQKAGQQLQPGPAEIPAAALEGRELLRQELLLSGAFERLAANLSRRVTASCADSVGAEIYAGQMQRERQRFFQRAGLDESMLAGWLMRLERDSSWLEKMIRIESAYQQRCELLLTPANRFQTLSVLRLPMMRFEVETIELESYPAAREAFLCLTEDGVPMANLAKDARYPYHRSECLLGDLPEALQQAFLGAAVGAVLEPWDRQGGFQLYRIVNKTEPSLEDSRVRDRVDRQILDSCFSDLDAKMIRWSLKEARAG